MRDCIDSGLNWVCIALPNEVTDVQINILSCIFGKRVYRKFKYDNEFR